MTPGSRIVTATSVAATGQVRKSRRRVTQSKQTGWSRWLGEPRNTVFLVLAGALTIGGGRKLLQWWRAREVVASLGEAGLTVEMIEAAANHGRAPLMDLFRILTTAETEPLRQAAGRTLAVLWAQDNLIVEEEKALILRGFTTIWRARRRYPRQIHSPIPISVSYGIPFLSQNGVGIGPENLEWSHRITGTRRATYETFSPWVAGSATAEIELIPDDFDTNGPHRLVLQPRVRTRGLTETWEFELPQIPFQLEFDPVLTPGALFTLADSSREESMSNAVRIEPNESEDGKGLIPAYLPLNQAFGLRNPPGLLVQTPLSCDLSHSLEIEVEGVEGQFAAGTVILSGQGANREAPPMLRQFPIGPVAPLPEMAIDRPGTRKIRGILRPDPDRGWGDPEIRSIWPGTLETDWVEVEIIRR